MNLSGNVDTDVNSDRAIQKRLARMFELMNQEDAKKRAEIREQFPYATEQELRLRFIACS